MTVDLQPHRLRGEIGAAPFRSPVVPDQASQTVTGLTWASSDSNIVSLSTADPPVLTAVAPGHVTITAGGASADVTVWSEIPVGAPLWSNPSVTGTLLLPAVPSQFGAGDVFSIQDGLIQAVTTEGQVAWSANEGQLWNATTYDGYALPDFQGGLVLVNYASGLTGDTVKRLDGLTGQVAWQFTDRAVTHAVLHPDGTIFTHEYDWEEEDDAAANSIVAIDPATGTEKFRIGDIGVYQSDMIVAGDGYAYIAYVEENEVAESALLKVLKIDSDGAFERISVWNYVGPWWNGGIWFPINRGAIAPALITNDDDSVFLSWMTDAYVAHTGEVHWTKISSAGVHDITGPRIAGQEQWPVAPVLQREDGSFVGVAFVGPWQLPTDFDAYHMVVFNVSGEVQWSTPNDLPVSVTSHAEAIGTSGTIYSQVGGANGAVPNQVTHSWTGIRYSSSSGLSSVGNAVNLPGPSKLLVNERRKP